MTPETHYAYYRRCQVFLKNGEQCKAPAEKGAQICYAHAAQQSLALRRERERQAVLDEAVAEMRRRGRPEFEAKDLFMDFNGIQVTIAKMAQALIAGRIDCKTAGRLAVELQTMSKLLWIYHRGHRGTRSQKTSPRMNTDNTDLKTLANIELQQCVNEPLQCEFEAVEAGDTCGRCADELTVETKVLMFPLSSRGDAHGRYWTGQQTRAA